MPDDEKLKKSHMAIVLGIGLGVLVLIVTSLTLTILVNRRARGSFFGLRKDPDERLRKLDKVSPTCTLEKWWTTTKGNLGLSEAVDGEFVCAVCLEQVDRAHEIRELRCLHVFHRECLEKWFLTDHFNCPLCHSTYYVSQSPTRNPDYVWMV